MEKFTALFGKAKTEGDAKFAEHEKAMLALAEKAKETDEKLTKRTKENGELKTEIAELKKQNGEFAEKFAQLEKQESRHHTPAPKQAGGKGANVELTDY